MLTAGQSCTIHPPVQLNFVGARATGRTPSVTDGDPLRCRIEIRAMPERVPKAAKHNLRRLSWRFTDTRVAFPTRMHPHLRRRGAARRKSSCASAVGGLLQQLRRNFLSGVKRAGWFILNALFDGDQRNRLHRAYVFLRLEAQRSICHGGTCHQVTHQDRNNSSSADH